MYTPDTADKDASLLEFTMLPAVTYRETEDFIVKFYIVNEIRKITSVQ